MKKLLLFVKLILSFCLIMCANLLYFVGNSPTIKSYNNSLAADLSQVSYAKAKEHCILYKTEAASDNIAEQYFYVPNSYFVTILSKVADNLFKVSYKNFVGYCKSDDLSAVSFTPNTPVLDEITFDITSTAGTQVWSAPSDQSGSKITTIPADTRALEYIADINGEVPVGGSTTTWYYCRYTPASNSTRVYEGYVYSEATTNLSHIPTNLEHENEEVNLPIAGKSIPLNTTLRAVLICLICLPFVILFILTLAKSKNKIFAKHKRSKEAEENNLPSATTISAAPSKRQPIGSLAKRQFIKKQPKYKEDDHDLSVEVVFPEYSYVDDDDLL